MCRNATSLPSISIPSRIQRNSNRMRRPSNLLHLGTALGKSGIGSNIADAFATPDFGAASDFARGGRIHRGEGGGIDADPNSIQAANDAFLADNQGFGLGLVPPANAAIAPAVSPPTQAGPSDLERFLNERRTASLHASPTDYGAPAPVASTMGAQSAIPGSGQYTEMGYDGRPIGAPQSAAPDPALAQKASITPSIGEKLQDRTPGFFSCPASRHCESSTSPRPNCAASSPTIKSSWGCAEYR